MSEAVLSSVIAAEEDEVGYYDVIQPVDGVATYDGDFAAWAFDQAKRLRALKSNDLDIKNLAEEIEDLGKGVVNKLESLLKVVLLHLLKWDHQPLFRGSSWEVSVSKARRQIAKHLRRHPSLKAICDQAVVEAYDDARYDAAEETGMALKHFPVVNPYDWDAIMDRALKRSDPE